ncbi:hypothetical protein D9757_014081 [Collybiopsis confluens]|uniref:Uncharacterized protein n=1 Tax=Collybiopsis confluens TaxID=2823264 RepID=A0A8H5GDK2_9AGAR|nr:hypothetical protein D9757_014081 [Collybiopsis confluens]
MGDLGAKALPSLSASFHLHPSSLLQSVLGYIERPAHFQENQLAVEVNGYYESLAQFCPVSVGIK